MANLGKAREIIGRRVEFYNGSRLHVSLNCLPLEEYWAGDPEARVQGRKEKLERGPERREKIKRQRLQEAV